MLFLPFFRLLHNLHTADHQMFMTTMTVTMTAPDRQELLLNNKGLKNWMQDPFNQITSEKGNSWTFTWNIPQGKKSYYPDLYLTCHLIMPSSFISIRGPSSQFNIIHNNCLLNFSLLTLMRASAVDLFDKGQFGNHCTISFSYKWSSSIFPLAWIYVS